MASAAARSATRTGGLKKPPIHAQTPGSGAAAPVIIAVVQIDPDALPEDTATLQLMLRTVLLQQGALAAENDKMRLLIQRLTRHQFGRRSEQLTPDQLQLALEELEQTIAANQAGQDSVAAAAGLPRKPRAEAAGRNHGALPAHLPRYEVVIDVEDRACPCCGHALHAIGELRTEQLDMVPSQLRVRVTRRPRYACHGCEGAVVVAPAPDRPVDGGMPTEALVAHVVVSKFADALPLYRQAQMLERQGITLDRSTLANWVGRACWWLTPLYELMLGTVLGVGRRCSPTTPRCQCSIPGRGRTKTGRLWCYAVDDRPWKAARATRWRPTSTRTTARTSAQPGTSPGFAACCRSMATAGSRPWPAGAPGRVGDAGVLLVAYAATLLRPVRVGQIAAGSRGAGAGQRAVCH